eukprot:498194-Rhodomonas_salina.2
MEENLVFLCLGGSSFPEGMSASVAGPGVFQNEDPFAVRIHSDNHSVRLQLELGLERRDVMGEGALCPSPNSQGDMAGGLALKT